MTEYPPGTVGLSTIDGRLGTMVRAGQWFMRADKADRKYTHAFIVGADGWVYEAMPQGVQRNTLAAYLQDVEAGDQVLFIDVPLTDEQRAGIVKVGDELVAARMGYSFLSYLYLALKRIGIPVAPLRWVIRRRHERICSQLDDYMLNRVGFQAFQDGREWMDVIPADFHAAVRTDFRFRVLDAVKVTP